MRKFFSSFLEVLEIAAIAIGVVFVVRTFLIQPFLVSGTSMYPTFQNGDYVLTDELTFRVRPPERGEVVVFHDVSDSSTYLIKRVIGLPGETVIVKNNDVTIENAQHPQGFVLNEKYLPVGTQTLGDGTWTLSSSSYMMLGDNRIVSYDSRVWGPLPAKDIVGLVRLRLWPLTGVDIFNAPQYNAS